jgi:molybdopterin-binding protein
VPAAEIDRLRGDVNGAAITARNRFRGTITEVKVDGLMAQVEIVVSDPVKFVAVVTRDAIADLALKPGMATSIVKSTSVMVQQ